MFTAGHPGSYTATWSLTTENKSGDDWIVVFLRKNGEKITESEIKSHYTGASGLVLEQGGRTLVLHLERGDTMDLYCDKCQAGIDFITICVSLSQFDVI